jgi:hypothetical protein
MIVPPGHVGGARGITSTGGSVVTSEEVVWSHGKEDVLVPAATKEEHATSGVKAEHCVLALEVLDGHLQVHLEAEVMICSEVGKEWGEAKTVADSEVVVYHGSVRIGLEIHGNVDNLTVTPTAFKFHPCNPPHDWIFHCSTTWCWTCWFHTIFSKSLSVSHTPSYLTIF